MRGKPLFPFAATAVLGLLSIFLLSLVGLNVGSEQAAENGEEQQEETSDDPIELGQSVYEGNCASCHGGDLGGGVGPALDGGYSADDVTTAISEGPGDMPADIVQGEEADAVAEFIAAENE
ncbi:c-type cytochrome [Alkalicoccus urumqiensis]|uniref:Cytochrome C551 n=1 Tax=Alkalicoccus urumqiensis TaxID=1548213 RepID=A0A2P6MFU7_ALKUR|nr:cytochrome c [Alkalicoccus urumqiensis]PRO65120.1 cytochrome C551 [Alkalicoccus urumqiensis]